MIIDEFSKYQIERLVSHCDIEFNKEEEDLIIRFLKDTAEMYQRENECEDCISREAVMECFKKWQPYMATRLWDYELELKDLPSVTPTSDAEGDYESGYNCGYADAINDMA